ncbi:flippase [Gramella sp. MT6]|uniref:flippase n=1 Tax=Gramella sp. MT6 TaxID=2705471 RepID=UPI001C5FECED|nr:flippase [Gramella sp. MT6]QYA24394.1 flippase [Gramella sp. MT6]
MNILALKNIINSTRIFTAGKSIAKLWSSSLLSAGFAFLIQILLARYLQPESYGMFMSSLVLITSLVPLVGFGVHSYWLKAFGNEGWEAMGFVKSSFRFLTRSAFIGVVAIILWAFLGGHNSSTKLVLLILLPYLLGQTFLELVNAKFQLEERFTALAIWQLMPNLLRLVLLNLCFLLVDSFSGLLGVSFIYSSVSIVVCIYGYREMKKMLNGKFTLKGHIPKHTTLNFPKKYEKQTWEVIRLTWPFGLGSLFHLIYFQSDIILLRYLYGSSEAGIYSVAFTVITASLLLPSVIYQKFLLPKLHRWSHQNLDLFHRVYKKGNLLMLIMGSFAMAVVFLSADGLIHYLFGKTYTEAVFLLKILSLNIPILFVASSVGSVLVTQEHMSLKVKIMGVVALLNIVLNIIVLPKYGGLGAACTTVMSNLLLLSLYFYSAEKKVFNKHK